MATLSKIHCPVCQVSFTKTGKNQKYCSRKCRISTPEYKAGRAEYNKERRLWIEEYKLEHGCCKCGYKEHAAALDFNHINPLEKSFGIGESMSKSRELVEAEIAKCEVLCANCHRIHTYETHATRLGTARTPSTATTN